MDEEGIVPGVDVAADVVGVPGTAGAMDKVTTFLDAERARQKTARRTWIGLAGLLATVGLLHGLTLAGVLPPEGRDVLASAGAVGFGLASRL